MYTQIDIQIYICKGTYMCVCVCSYIYTYISIRIHIYMYVHIYTHMCIEQNFENLAVETIVQPLISIIDAKLLQTWTCSYTHICTIVYIYIYIYRYIWSKNLSIWRLNSFLNRSLALLMPNCCIWTHIYIHTYIYMDTYTFTYTYTKVYGAGPWAFGGWPYLAAAD